MASRESTLCHCTNGVGARVGREVGESRQWLRSYKVSRVMKIKKKPSERERRRSLEAQGGPPRLRVRSRCALTAPEQPPHCLQKSLWPSTRTGTAAPLPAVCPCAFSPALRVRPVPVPGPHALWCVLCLALVTRYQRQGSDPMFHCTPQCVCHA